MGGADDFAAIDELLSGYRAAQILMTAGRLGLFDALEGKTLTAAEAAAATGSEERGTRILCDALAALQILEKSGDRYRNSELASRFLTSSSPHSRASTVRHGAVLYERWGRLFDAVREGRAVTDEEIDPRLARDRREFAGAMAEIGRTVAAQTAEKLDLGGARSLLDVGGGPGVYAIEFARRNPQLRVTILDDEETLQVARRNVSQAGLADRVRLLPGDAFRDSLGSGYDCVFISNLVHIYSAEENRNPTARCAHALAPGGKLAVKDFLLEPSRTAPLGSALFAVTMLVATDGGDCFTVEQIREWMEAAGLVFERVVPLTEQSSLFVGRKPKS